MSKKNAIHMLQNMSPTQMQSFIIEEESGKILVIDGGNVEDADHLLEKLQEITGEEVPHIDAWIFTHPHSDHMNAFFTLMENKPEAFKFEEIYCCFPSVYYLNTCKTEEKPADTLSTFIRMSPLFAERIVTVSEDDVYKFGTAKMEVLRTVDCSIKNNHTNNASMVFKLYLGTKTILFLGDLGVEGGNKLLETRGKQLKSDICQMAHHGQYGVDEKFYRAVQPDICLWCAPDWLWNNDMGKGYNTHGFQTVIVRGWMEKLGVKEHYVIKDGDQKIEC